MATIYTNKGIAILVDDEDHEWLSQYSWYVGRTGYAITVLPKADRKQIPTSMHRLIMLAPPGSLVDHINRNRCDNRRSNLRFATKSENTLNASPKRKVDFDPVTRKHWLLRGVELIGIYDTKEQVWQAWRESAHGKMPSVTNIAIPSD